MTQVERWEFLELSLDGPQEGNPFVDVGLSARFSHKHGVVEVAGFYDGDGVYRVRFMPDTLGAWSHTTISNRAELDGVEGQFTCTEPSPGNHGPVRVSNTYHFCYADGSPYFPIGTTCYAWNHQGDVLEEQTLETLRTAPFNKLRMCAFPKHYAYNANEPVYHAFERTESGEWPFELPNRGLDADTQFQAEIIDAWEMTITPVEGVFEVEPRDRYCCVSQGNRTIRLPGKPYIALRIQRVQRDQP